MSPCRDPLSPCSRRRSRVNPSTRTCAVGSCVVGRRVKRERAREPKAVRVVRPGRVLRAAARMAGARDASSMAGVGAFPKAVKKITDDEDGLLAFYDYPMEHWILRTTSPIESTFATVRLRTKVIKGAGSRAAGLATVFMLIG